MGLADTFQQIVDSLPDDWTDLELDLRIFDERRYIDAAVLLVTCNAQPYSKSDWHWRVLVAHRFGHAAAPPAVHAALAPGIRADVLVVDLTADAGERIEQARGAREAGVPMLAFYSHVETEVRALAEQAGFDLVVPRSRIAREGAALVERLSA